MTTGFSEPRRSEPVEPVESSEPAQLVESGAQPPESSPANSRDTPGNRDTPEDVAGWLWKFEPPPFQPHRLLRGGHLQTLIAPKHRKDDAEASATWLSQRHQVQLADGDSLALLDDCPPDWKPKDGAVVLLHGICGCHQAGYMLRFYRRLCRSGIRTFRLDMRGCGASVSTCQQITHAGRSGDILSAIHTVDALVNDDDLSLGIAGVSLGGNQILKLAGEMADGPSDQAWNQVRGLLAIAPPIDLQACSDEMERTSLRFYNWYFIRHLLRRSAPQIVNQSEFRAALSRGRPKTLRVFDRHITAPLAGFRDERDYYENSSAIRFLDRVEKPALIVVATDDPLVPAKTFHEFVSQKSKSAVEANAGRVRIHTEPTGGHHGFLKRDRTAWTDDLIASFFTSAFDHARYDKKKRS